MEGDEEGEEEHEQVEAHQQLRGHVEVEHGLKVAEAQEREELDVPLDQDFHQHPPEGVDAEEPADFVVKETVKYSVEEYHSDQSEWEEEDKIVDDALDEEVALPLLSR